MEKVYKYYEIVASEGYYRVSIDTVSHQVTAFKSRGSCRNSFQRRSSEKYLGQE